VNPNHGLYAFFRKREKDGKVTHDPFEDEPGLQDIFGEWQWQYPSIKQQLWCGFFSRQVELGLQQSCEEKASGIFIPCGMSSWENVALLQHKWRAIDALPFRLVCWETYKSGIVRYVCCAAVFLLSLGLCPDISIFLLKCRKSMARIKYVINERRLAYEGAMKIHAEKVEQAAKENETETGRLEGAVHQESDAQKVSPPLSEATQVAVDSLLQRSAP
jgi:hypothetical protein